MLMLAVLLMEKAGSHQFDRPGNQSMGAQVGWRARLGKEGLLAARSGCRRLWLNHHVLKGGWGSLGKMTCRNEVVDLNKSRHYCIETEVGGLVCTAEVG